MLKTSSLLARILAALAVGGTLAAVVAPGGCSASISGSGGNGTGGNGTGGNGTGGGDVGGDGTGGDCGDVPNYMECFTLAELAAYTYDAMTPSQCPGANDLMDTDFCSGFSSGPTVMGDMCCYEMWDGGNCCGRPFVVSGEVRRAAVARRADWIRDVAPAEPLDAATRAELALAWLSDARLEHASIASFARFTLELLGLGAPPDLVAGAQRASLDEIEHARACYALASRYAGERLGPGPLSIEGALSTVDLAEAAAGAVREGCIGETTAAALAAEQLEVAEDEDARRALSAIVRDEEAHAELSWRFVRWAIEAGGEPVRASVARAFSTLLAAAPPSSPTETVDPAAWHRHGRLTGAEVERVTQAVRREVIAPCARALLALPASRPEAVVS